jgi:hypothetical protein
MFIFAFVIYGISIKNWLLHAQPNMCAQRFYLLARLFFSENAIDRIEIRAAGFGFF